jgi:hypothetical protein
LGGLLLVQIFSPVFVDATTIFGLRTNADLYMGADSKVTLELGDGTLSYELQCKIQQVGKMFFAAAGPYGHKITGLDVRVSLIEAQREASGVSQQLERFDTLYMEALGRALVYVLNKSPEGYKRFYARKLIHVFFVWVKNEAPAYSHKTFTHKINATGDFDLSVETRECPPGCKNPDSTQPFGVGHVDAKKHLSSTRRSAVEVINDYIKASINGGAGQSGPPIDILYLNKNGARWIQNEKGCPEIQP